VSFFSSLSLGKAVIWVLVLLAVIAIILSFFSPASDADRSPISRVIEEARDGQVDKIVVRGDSLTITLESGLNYKSRKEQDSDLVTILQNEDVQIGGAEGVIVEVKRTGFGGSVGGVIGLIINFLPLILFAAILVFFMRRASSGVRT